jgi:hypothetical protein
VASASSGRPERIDGDAVSAAGAFVLASGVQGGHAPAPGYETLLIVLLIAAFLAACVPIFIHLRRRDRRPKPLADQWQALAVMGELCPHGWQAQITLSGGDAPVPEGAPPSRVPLVALEWTQFAEDSGHVAVARRVWSPTIVEALQMMVEGRRTDITLEQIEQAMAERDDVHGND